MQKAARPKRPRALQACEVCRTRKNRCSGDLPCTYCVDHDLDCVYSRTPPSKKQKLRQPSSLTETWIASNDPSHSPQATVSETHDVRLSNVNQALPSKKYPVWQPRSNSVGVVPQQDRISVPPTTVDSSQTPLTTTTRNTASDVVDTNIHTSNLEFYGSASSVAFLRHVETLANCQTTGASAGPPERSLASLLHNTDFRPDASHSIPVTPQEADLSQNRFYFRIARRFLDAYFSNIHYIQPLFEEEEFLARCEDLWFDRPSKQPLSFIALYYATLSLGSLVMTLENTEILGADRFTWSRRLSNDALTILTRLGTATDVEMVQCFYMMSKICQHELNPHVAYLYSGQAARTSLAIGINRNSLKTDVEDLPASILASKTWWAVYCLDIQNSFALGRPDSLGPDQYHTQSFPFTESGESNTSPHVLQIIPCMVELSRIMRKVALELYTQPREMEQKLHQARMLDAELENWLEGTPLHLRSEQRGKSDLSLKPQRLASYVKKQSVVLRLRYLNLRMVIHAVFMTAAEATGTEDATCLRKCQCRCIQAAEDAIDLIYTTFRTDDYFQTWWYNSTYTLFAVSVLLAVVFRQLARTESALETLFAHIDRAIIVLQAMDDCLVARNATAIIKRTLDRARKVPQPALNLRQSSPPQVAHVNGTKHPIQVVVNQENNDDSNTFLQSQATDGNDFRQSGGDLDWLNTYPFDDSQQGLFWTQWLHGIDTLGT